MKREKQIKRAFGLNEFGIADMPKKVSNVQISRLVYCKKECSYCFPHGWETSNSTLKNNQRNWKQFRKTRWKHKLSYEFDLLHPLSTKAFKRLYTEGLLFREKVLKCLF